MRDHCVYKRRILVDFRGCSLSDTRRGAVRMSGLEKTTASLSETRRRRVAVMTVTAIEQD